MSLPASVQVSVSIMSETSSKLVHEHPTKLDSDPAGEPSLAKQAPSPHEGLVRSLRWLLSRLM